MLQRCHFLRHFCIKLWKFLSAFLCSADFRPCPTPLPALLSTAHVWKNSARAGPLKTRQNPKIFPFPSKIPVKLTKSRISTIVLCNDSLDFYGISHLFCRHAFVSRRRSVTDQRYQIVIFKIFQIKVRKVSCKTNFNQRN